MTLSAKSYLKVFSRARFCRAGDGEHFQPTRGFAAPHDRENPCQRSPPELASYFHARPLLYDHLRREAQRNLEDQNPPHISFFFSRVSGEKPQPNGTRERLAYKMIVGYSGYHISLLICGGPSPSPRPLRDRSSIRRWAEIETYMFNYVCGCEESWKRRIHAYTLKA